MSYSKDSLFKRETLRETFLKIFFKDRIKSNYFMCHKPDNSLKVFIVSFRKSTFPFKLSGFIDSRVNAYKGNKLFRSFKIGNTSYFSQKLDGRNFTNTFYRGKDFKLISYKTLCQFINNCINFVKFFREKDKSRNFLREDKFFRFILRGDRVFGQGDNLLSRDKRFSTFSGIEEGINCFYRRVFNDVRRAKQIKGRLRERIYVLWELREGYCKEFFNIIFKFGYLRGYIFSFSCQLFKLLKGLGAKFFIQRFMIVKQERGNGEGIFFVCFGFFLGRV